MGPHKETIAPDRSVIEEGTWFILQKAGTASTTRRNLGMKYHCLVLKT